jgi:hypothetical protein
MTANSAWKKGAAVKVRVQNVKTNAVSNAATISWGSGKAVKAGSWTFTPGTTGAVVARAVNSTTTGKPIAAHAMVDIGYKMYYRSGAKWVEMPAKGFTRKQGEIVEVLVKHGDQVVKQVKLPWAKPYNVSDLGGRLKMEANGNLIYAEAPPTEAVKSTIKSLLTNYVNDITNRLTQVNTWTAMIGTAKTGDEVKLHATNALNTMVDVIQSLKDGNAYLVEAAKYLSTDEVNKVSAKLKSISSTMVDTGNKIGASMSSQNAVIRKMMEEKKTQDILAIVGTVLAGLSALSVGASLVAGFGNGIKNYIPIIQKERNELARLQGLGVRTAQQQTRMEELAGFSVTWAKAGVWSGLVGGGLAAVQFMVQTPLDFTIGGKKGIKSVEQWKAEINKLPPPVKKIFQDQMTIMTNIGQAEYHLSLEMMKLSFHTFTNRPDNDGFNHFSYQVSYDQNTTEWKSAYHANPQLGNNQLPNLNAEDNAAMAIALLRAVNRLENPYNKKAPKLPNHPDAQKLENLLYDMMRAGRCDNGGAPGFAALINVADLRYRASQAGISDQMMTYLNSFSRVTDDIAVTTPGLNGKGPTDWWGDVTAAISFLPKSW